MAVPEDTCDEEMGPEIQRDKSPSHHWNPFFFHVFPFQCFSSFFLTGSFPFFLLSESYQEPVDTQLNVHFWHFVLENALGDHGITVLSSYLP